MAAPRFKVIYLDGREEEVLAGPKAQVELERHFGVALGKEERVEHIYYMAWAALHKAGKEPAEFDEFLDLIDDVDEVEEQPVDPTPKARRTGGTSS